MKGVIILPTFWRERWLPELTIKGLDFSKVKGGQGQFFYKAAETFDFELRYADEVDIDSNTDILLVWGVPYHDRPQMIPGLMDVNCKTKLIIYSGDLQCYNNRLCLENKIKVFTKADLIISGSFEYFSKLYPQFLDKYRFFPKFFASDEFYSKLPLNTAPTMKCLLSGAAHPKIYMLRDFILKQNLPFIDYRRANYALGGSYAKLLNSYSCCVTCSSIFKYAVAKYFEIPASGSLLIADETTDSKRAGLIPNKHYISITTENAVETIKHCVNNIDQYAHIRKEGMEFVRANHSINNRIEQFRILCSQLLESDR
jgi:hypothetical protein